METRALLHAPIVVHLPTETRRRTLLAAGGGKLRVATFWLTITRNVSHTVFKYTQLPLKGPVDL